MHEEWRPAPSAPALYEVSNLGRCRRKGSAKALRANVSVRGYRVVHLACGGGRGGITARLLHREICRAFNGEPPFGGALVRHLDGDSLNNLPENLAWGTAKDNAEDAARHGTRPTGERHGQAKLTWSQVRSIRAALDGGASRSEMARRYAISKTAVASLATGKTWVEEE